MMLSEPNTSLSITVQSSTGFKLGFLVSNFTDRYSDEVELTIAFAHQRQAVVVPYYTDGTAFAATQSCQPEARPKQRCHKCEGERLIDVISQDRLSLTHKTSRCAFRTGTLHGPSSLPITKGCVKYAPLLLLQERWALHMGVFPLKSLTLLS